MPDAKIYCNGAWHTLAGQKVRQNGEWVTIPRAGRIRINGAWADLHTHVWNYTSSTDTCSDCGATLAHVHKWNSSNGCCETCGSVCLHDWIHNAFTPTKSTCAICGKVCYHSWNSETGKCNTCGKTCSHSWNSETGKCNYCKQEHTHRWADTSDGNRRCAGCLKVCDHDGTYAYGPEYDTCRVCGYKVQHNHYWICEWQSYAYNYLSAHTCFKCRTIEAHLFDEYGICSACGHVCPHDNSDDGVCSYCGLTKSTRLLLKRIAKPYTVILNGTQHEVAAGDGYVIVEPQVGDNTFQIVQAVAGYRFKGFLKNGMISSAGSAPKVIEPFTITFEKNRQATFKTSLD